MTYPHKTILCFLCALCPVLHAGTDHHPSAVALMQKYAKHMDKIVSFRAKSSCDRKGSGFYSDGKVHEFSTSCETFYDGRRCAVRTFLWGEPRPGAKVKKDDAMYLSELWDGENRYQYDRPSPSTSRPGYVTVTQKPQPHLGRPPRIAALQESGAQEAMGYLPGEIERVDQIVGTAVSTTVRPKKEKVGNTPCFVIDADTSHGDFSLWIDPNRSHVLVKAQVKISAGQTYSNGQVLPEGQETVVTVEHTRFQKVGDTWIPIESRFTRNIRLSDGRRADDQGYTLLTEFVLNPDHDALGAFTPNDILDGASVRVVDPQGNTTRHVWRGDGYVPETEETAGKGANGGTGPGL